MYLLPAPLFTLFLFILQHCVVGTPSRRIEERQGGDNLAFCFGENSICTFSTKLFSQCENIISDTQKWYNCVCANGYVSVDEACIWCQAAYKLSYIDDTNLNKEGCSSAGVPIAPIPSSILAVESNYNQTYTGVLLATSFTNTGASVTNSGVSFTNPGASPTRSGVNPGVTSIVTLNGGGQGAPTTTPISNVGESGGSSSTTAISTAKVGSAAGGSEGRNRCGAFVFSFVAFGLSVLSLI